MKNISGVLIGLLAIVPTLSYADADDVLDYYKKHSKDELLVDLMQKETFAPPYQSMDSLVGMAEVCKEDFFDEEPMHRTYMQIMAKNEYLGVASPNTNSVLGTLVNNSGGMTALYDYVAGDFVYLVNVSNRYQAKDAAQKLFDQFNASPQMKKAQASQQILFDKKQGKDVDDVVYKSTRTAIMCGIVDLFYTVLGGQEYSNSVDTLAGVKQQIHRETMDSTMSQLNELSQ